MEKVKSLFKKKKKRDKKMETSNGSSAQNSSAVDIAVPNVQRQNPPNQDGQDIKVEKQKTEEQRAHVSSDSLLRQQEGTSSTNDKRWDNIYPSLPKPPAVNGGKSCPGASRAPNQVSPKEEEEELCSQGGAVGAMGLQQNGDLERQSPNSESNNQPSADSTKEYSSPGGVQEPTDLTSTQVKQYENLENQTPQIFTPAGVQESTDLMSQIALNDNLAQASPQENLGNQVQSSSITREINVDFQNQERQIPHSELSPQTRQENEMLNAADGEDGEDEGSGQQIHAQEEATPSEEPLVSGLQANDTLMDKVSLMLHPYNPVIKNWEGLAHELHAPPNIRAQCKRITHHSQTRVLFDTLSTSAETEDLIVNQLITVLNDLNRKDVVELLKKKIPVTRRQNKVTEEVTSNEELMEELETVLDKESRVVKNWYNLGLKLRLSKETLQGIRDGNSCDDVPALFDYIYTKLPNLTVGEFKDKMISINRKDIVDKLSDVHPGRMKDRIALDSDEMRSLCYLLTRNSCGTVKNWKHLARALDIDYIKYKRFDKETPESPTRILIDWALAANPLMTVQYLCGLFKNMKRYDVIEAIEEYYGRSFIQS